MKNIRNLALTAALFGVLASVSSASAGTITANFRASNTGPFPSTQNDNDFSFEYLATDVNGNGIVDIGDSIWGVASFESIGRAFGPVGTRLPTGQDPSFQTEFTGIFATQIVNKTGTGLASEYVMGPDAAFTAQFGLNAGAMFALFDDPAQNFDPTAPLVGAGNIFELASDGTKVLEAGFSGALPTIANPSNAVGETWTAFGNDNPSLLPPNPGPGGGGFNASLNFLFQGGGYQNFIISNSQLSLDLVNFVQVSVNGDIFAGGQGSTLPIANSADVFYTIEAVVPEPGSLAIWGVLVVGAGGVARRRRKKAA